MSRARDEQDMRNGLEVMRWIESQPPTKAKRRGAAKSGGA